VCVRSIRRRRMFREGRSERRRRCRRIPKRRQLRFGPIICLVGATAVGLQRLRQKGGAGLASIAPPFRLIKSFILIVLAQQPSVAAAHLQVTPQVTAARARLFTRSCRRFTVALFCVCVCVCVCVCRPHFSLEATTAVPADAFPALFRHERIVTSLSCRRLVSRHRISGLYHTSSIQPYQREHQQQQ